jgi:hypothetical protein
MLLNTLHAHYVERFFRLDKTHKSKLSFEGAAEAACWALAIKVIILRLENRKKICKIVYEEDYLPFY